ncbi:DUF2115 domain-containing protein [Methanobrevibacter sp. DSM 116169]|uniref:DUF2115 domain-containing protein n=1 Tax=Methanobrevibacter sp. DSM 116169 TaxID=3242727 RepID=UPI0038FCE2B6
MYDDKKIFTDLKKLSKTGSTNQEDLFKLLKKYSKTISVFDLMAGSILLKDDVQHVQQRYREEFLNVYINCYITIIKDIKDNKRIYDEILDIGEFNNFIDLLEKQFEDNRANERRKSKNESRIPLTYVLSSLYANFILKEPIHPVGTPFPGGLKVELIDGVYYCPIKELQSLNPHAVCQLCMAEQTEK